MRKITLKMLFFMLVSVGVVQAQQIVNINTSTQNCQCDTITVSFSVVAALNSGNQFTVELSDGTGDFTTPTNIEISPLLGFSVGGYNMDAIIPCSQAQGAYSIRVAASNPIVVSDTITNVIVGALPNTDMTIFGTYSHGQTQRYCANDTAYLVGPPPPVGETHTYQWYQNGAPLVGETADSLLIVNTSGVFSVLVTRGLCDAMSVDTIVNVYSPPAYILHTPDPNITVVSGVGQDSIQFCEGTIAVLNAPGTFNPIDTFFYQWYTDSVDVFGQPIMYPLPGDTMQTLNVDSAGTYYVSVMSLPGGCLDTSEVFTIFVDSIPNTSIVNLSSLILCLEDTVTLSALDSIAYPGWEYQWQGEFPFGSGMWVDAPVDTMPFITVDSVLVSFADSVRFRLKIKNNTCEFITNELMVVFIANPAFTFVPGDSISVCAGDSSLVFAQGSGVISYQWSNGKLGNSIWVTQADQGTVTCVATGLNGCTYQRDLKVGVFTITADAGPDQTVKPGEYAQLAGTGGVNYYWFSNFPADYNDRKIPDPRVLPTTDTTMFIMVATGANGCIDQDTMFVYVVADELTDDERLRNVQNVITPNGDGKNDFLDLSDVLNGDDCGISILDRWGREVFQVDSYQNTWNGVTSAGKDLPDGTYYYLVKCGDNITFKAPVTIIRNQN